MISRLGCYLFFACRGFVYPAFQEPSGSPSADERHRGLVGGLVIQLKGKGFLLLLWVKVRITLEGSGLVLGRFFFPQTGKSRTWKWTVHSVNNYNALDKFIYLFLINHSINSFYYLHIKFFNKTVILFYIIHLHDSFISSIAVLNCLIQLFIFEVRC